MLKRLVDRDSYLTEKEKYQGDGFIESVPVDMNGQPSPIGYSASDKSANRKRVQEAIEDRFRC